MEDALGLHVGRVEEERVAAGLEAGRPEREGGALDVVAEAQEGRAVGVGRAGEDEQGVVLAPDGAREPDRHVLAVAHGRADVADPEVAAVPDGLEALQRVHVAQALAQRQARVAEDRADAAGRERAHGRHLEPEDEQEAHPGRRDQGRELDEWHAFRMDAVESGDLI